jgi:hypothetical protein
MSQDGPQVAAAAGSARTATPLQEECAALVLRLPDHVLATLVYQLRPLADPAVQRAIRELAGQGSDGEPAGTPS